VIIDAPGAGSRASPAAGQWKKASGAPDEDAAAFTSFITAFLSQVRALNSPKVPIRRELRTQRSAVLINNWRPGRAVDFKWRDFLPLARFLNFDPFSVDGAEKQSRQRTRPISPHCRTMPPKLVAQAGPKAPA